MSFDLSKIDIEHIAVTLGAALAILLIGFPIASWAAGLVRRGAERSKRLSPTLIPLLTTLTRLTLRGVVIIAALEKIGVQTASLLAVIGAAGLAIGLALKDTVADVASGIVLLVLRPFDIGDAVDIAGTGGIVEAIDIFQTRLTSFEGVPLVLGNSSVRASTISNFSRAKFRRIDLEIRVSYGDDIGKAKQVIEDLLRSESRVLKDRDLLVNVTALGDSAVVLLVRCWTGAPDFFGAKLDLTRAIKERLDGAGVSIPFPQRDIHMVSAA